MKDSFLRRRRNEAHTEGWSLSKRSRLAPESLVKKVQKMAHKGPIYTYFIKHLPLNISIKGLIIVDNSASLDQKTVTLEKKENGSHSLGRISEE